jgi:thioesterase domain-containing protein
VPLQPKGDLPPFFCVAGLGGNTMNLRHLAAALGPRQPFFGLQHRGVDGALRPHETVEEMAREFLADLRRVQPEGPYYLGGFSMGGLAAYEMAQQLLEAGEPVGGVVLLDTSNPQVLEWDLKGRVLSHLSNLVKVGPGYLRHRISEGRRRRHQARAQRERALAAEQDPFTYRIDLVTEKGNAAERGYQPRPFDAPVLLIKAAIKAPPVNGIGYPPNETNGWGSLVSPGKLEIRKMSSDHMGLVTEALAAETARHIAAALSSMRAGQSPGHRGGSGSTRGLSEPSDHPDGPRLGVRPA